jgi:glycosyltransferase involved in cell wall biosynthesis
LLLHFRDSQKRILISPSFGFKLTKPKIILLPDFPNWAFDYIARSMASRLSHRFKFRIEYAARQPEILGNESDLVYIFHWNLRPPAYWGLKKQQVIRDVASWAWELSHHGLKLSKEEFASNYLNDCVAATTPCAEIYNSLQPCFPNLVHCPNGVEHHYFSAGFRGVRPTGRLKIGWVGNPNDEHKVKGLHEILIPATKEYDFVYSHGSMTRRELRQFYSGIDILAIASKSESQPLPLLEAMSAGCFPVCTNVGIVPEILHSGKNGLVVERSIAAFASAFEWCEQNLDRLRAQRQSQIASVADESWDAWANRFGDLFDAVLEKQNACDFTLPAAMQGFANRSGKIQKSPNCQKSIIQRLTQLAQSNGNDLKDAIRRWFMGDRFQKAPGENIYNQIKRKQNWFIAIKRRFKELVIQRGADAAVITALKSAFRRFIFLP